PRSGASLSAPPTWPRETAPQPRGRSPAPEGPAAAPACRRRHADRRLAVRSWTPGNETRRLRQRPAPQRCGRAVVALSWGSPLPHLAFHHGLWLGGLSLRRPRVLSPFKERVERFAVLGGGT